ncbi:hypothetical protein [Promicromonospora kroppenstedtii]|nr:hypothetical protein [Promicromonospora kroppenstedtii]
MDTITFLHPATRVRMTGDVVDTQVQTGELLVERTDDGSRVWVKPGDVR